MEINSNKVLVWKNNLDYLDIGKIEETTQNKQKIVQTLFTGLTSVDNFNKSILDLIESYETKDFNPKFYNIFDMIQVEDINGFIISQLKWRRCSAYLVIQTSKTGFRYLCYFYDKIHHYGESFGTSYKLVEKKDIINAFRNKCDQIKDNVDFNKFPELRESIFNQNFEDNFGIN